MSGHLISLEHFLLNIRKYRETTSPFWNLTGFGNHPVQRTGHEDPYLERTPYYPGADIRRLDWRYYARSRKMVVKTGTHRIPENKSIRLDLSASVTMYPEKLHTSRLIGLSLGWRALEDGDNLTFHLDGLNPQENIFLRITEKNHLFLLDHFLMHFPEKNPVLDNILPRFFRQEYKTASVVWITDLYHYRMEFSGILRDYGNLGNRLHLLHLTVPQEEEPSSSRFLLDAETKESYYAPHPAQFTAIRKNGVEQRKKELFSHGFSYAEMDASRNPLENFHRTEG